MDWSTCVICKSGGGGGGLKCPADSLQGNGLEVYKAFLNAVEQFRSSESLPVDVDFTDVGGAENFLRNRLKWHKACHLKFAQSKHVKLQEQLKRKAEHADEGDGQRKSKRQSMDNSSMACIFSMESSGQLHECSTMALDEDLRRMATDLEDTTLLARISGGDLVAIEAKYHRNCLSAYRNRHRSSERAKQNTVVNEETRLLEARAYAEIVSYMESCAEDGSYMFKLSQLHALFEDRLHALGVDKIKNRTRLKMQLLAQFEGELQEQFDGRNILLVFNQGIAELLRDAMKHRDFESEALSMAKIATGIRAEMFDRQGVSFTGSFPTNYQGDSVPTSLKTLVSMLLNGANLQHQEAVESQICLTISQLVYFNARHEAPSGKATRHSTDREPPLPIYLGLNMRTKARSKILVNTLYDLGMSVSYDRVLELENSMACAACKRFEEEGLVCPAHLRKGLFTVGALDNTDHNLSSTTAQSSFHGTGISIFQFPTSENIGIIREPITIMAGESSGRYSLLDEYTIVPSVACKTSELTVPTANLTEIEGNLDVNKAEKSRWSEEAIRLLGKDKLEKDDYISWAAFHAGKQQKPVNPPAVIALLPLFYEKAATIAMIKHGMDVQRQITDHLNPGQIPVTAYDQRLFALAKFVQWRWPLTHGEDKHVVLFGGLHMEMALWSTIGDFLEGSRWTVALCDAGVATSGSADSFLKCSHLTKTRRSHQITALALTNLQRNAWQTLRDADGDETFERWKQKMIQQSPTFKYWNLILDYEILVLMFIRAHRIANFGLFVDTLETLVPWFFALDHTNYSRWFPIHIRDMKSLPDSIKEDIKKFWVLNKTSHTFSSIPLDQAHEQNNALVKGSGGAVGLTENAAAFRRWMVAGPEQTRLLKEFEIQFDEADGGSRQHEQGLSSQERFKTEITNLCQTITDMGNPFLGDFPELLVLDTRDCVDECVADTVRTIETTGNTQYKKYVQNVIIDRSVSIQEPIKKNSLALFKRPQSKETSKSKQQIVSLRNDCNLFSQLYIASKFRDGDLDEFFCHENHPWLPSLSEHGKLRLPSKKSDLLGLLAANKQGEPPTHFNTKVFNGPAVVHALPITDVSTFGEYSERVFLPWTKQQLQTCDRIDIVWDMYKSDSIKAATRTKRGKGVRRKVGRQTKLPRKFPDFLRDATNKEELFKLLTEDVSACDYPDDKQVYITSQQSVVSTGSGSVMPSCDHEEADTLICIHVQAAIQQDAKTILVRTVDTDVVVILIGVFFDFIPVPDIWVAFGMGKHFEYFSINRICQNLGESKCRALPVFHALTGSDSTSQFHGKGKKLTWEAWKSNPEVTAAFLSVVGHTFEHLELSSSAFDQLERFICVLYDRTSQLTSVNEMRQDLFSKKGLKMENIPPTQSALLQHANRAVYQASIWTTCLKVQQNVPTPDGYGWMKEECLWMPVWTLLPEASKVCQELLKCGCKSDPLCSRRCRCRQAGLSCTGLVSAEENANRT